MIKIVFSSTQTQLNRALRSLEPKIANRYDDERKGRVSLFTHPTGSNRDFHFKSPDGVNYSIALGFLPVDRKIYPKGQAIQVVVHASDRPAEKTVFWQFPKRDGTMPTRSRIRRELVAFRTENNPSPTIKCDPTRPQSKQVRDTIGIGWNRMLQAIQTASEKF